MRDLTLSQVARTGLCKQAEELRPYKVSKIDASIVERREAIEAAIAQWADGVYEDTFPIVQNAFRKEEYEGSNVLRDLFATDLAMQLNRMGDYLKKNGAVVERGRGATVVLGEAPDDIHLHSSVDFFVTIEGTRYAVKVKNKTVYSNAARKPENMPVNSPELAWLSMVGGHGAIWTLVHKDDTGTNFAEAYDEAVSKSGKVITGKNIVSLSVADTDCADTLLRAIKEAEEHPSCDTCDCRDLCKGNFTFRCKATEAAAGEKKEVRWTDEQLQVINHREGNMAVLAGPGSGKTAVLVERYVHLIESGIPAQGILLLVFSNAVADEIRDRIAARLSYDRCQRNALNVFTLNAFGQMLINDNPTALGGRFVVADACERKRLLTEILFPPTEDGSGLMSLRHRYRNLYGAFYGLDSLNKLMEKIDAGATAEDLKLSPEDFAEAVKVNETLHNRLSQMHAITYEQQIRMPYEWLLGDQRMATAYTRIYRYIMVDEAQDLDELQMQFIRLLSAEGNLVMVGDDDQSIYRFRKGSAEHLLAFAKQKTTKVVILRDNFRASEKLNGLANALIAESVEERQAKGYRYLREGNPGELVADATLLPAVVSTLLSDGIPARDIAILARTNKALETIAETLKGTVACSSSKDYVREDAVFGFIKGALDLAIHKEDAEPMSVYRVERALDALTVPADARMLPERVEQAIEALRNNLILWMVEEALEVWVEALALPNLTPNHPILCMIRDWCEVKALNGETLLEHMNRMVRLEDDTRIDYGADEDKVRLYTAHDSKGKEFPVVIVADAEAYADEEGSSEELRLLYVAMTRARNRLIIVGRAGAVNPYFSFLKEKAVPFEFKKGGETA